MFALPRLNDVYEKIHEAAADSSLWPETLATISIAAEGRGAMLVRTPFVDAAVVSPELEDPLAYYFEHGWNKRCVRMKHGFELSVARGIAVDQDFITADEMRRSPYYQEFLRPFDAPWFAALSMKIEGETWGLSIHRTEAQGAFSPEEQVRLLALRKKLLEAGEIAGVMARGRRQGYLEGLDAAGRPAALIDWKGKVVDVNHGMEKILGVDLAIRGRRLACDPSAQRELDEAIDLALKFDPRLPDTLGRAVIPRANGSRFFVTVAPYTPGRVADLGMVRAIAIFSDPHGLRHPNAKAIAAVFGLTPAEARLSEALLRTGNLIAAAAACGVTEGSARQYLKRVFHKTQATNQVELTARILGSGLI